MDDYQIKIFPAAKRDMEEIVEYLHTLSSQAALRHYDLFVEHIASLRQMPKRCPLVRDPVLRIKGYRYLVVKKYLVFFVVVKNVVQIRRIIYGKRNYSSLM